MKNRIRSVAVALVAAILTFAAAATEAPYYTFPRTLLNAVTAPGAGSILPLELRGSDQLATPVTTYSAVLAGTGTYSATVVVQVSNDQTDWYTLATFTLSNSTPTGGTTSQASWGYVQGNVTAISGTGASVTVLMNP